MIARKKPATKGAGRNSGPREDHISHPIIPFADLSAMQTVLRSGAPLDKATRKRIADAIECFKVGEMIAHDKANPRPKIKPEIWVNAQLVRLLVDEHDASVKTAACAVLPRDATGKEVTALQRTYHDLKNGKSPFTKMAINSKVIADAVARLPAKRKPSKP